MLGIKKKYDVVFSIGAACSCTMSLRAAGMQFLSFPYDWLYGATMEARAELLCNDFSGFLNMEDLMFLRKNPQNEMDIYENKKTGMVFNHDFPAGLNLSESFHDVALKYKRRISRLLKLLSDARSILVVYMDPPGAQPTDVSAAIKTQQMLQRRYPGTVDLVLFKMQQSGFLEQRYGENVRMFCLDYKDHSPGVDSWDVDNKLVGRILSKRYRCSDYRSRQEKQAHKHGAVLQKYERLGVDSAFHYHIRRMNMNVKRFVKKHILGCMK